MLSSKAIIAIVVAIAAIFCLVCAKSVAEDVRNEEIVVNQFPFTGEMAYWTTPGLKFQWFGKTTYYFKTQQFWFGSSDDDNHQQDNPILVIFNDASDGRICSLCSNHSSATNSRVEQW